jgi:hypothetical protein
MLAPLRPLVAAATLTLFTCGCTPTKASSPSKFAVSPVDAAPEAVRPEAGSLPAFDRNAATRALASVDVSSCAREQASRGPGRVSITFAQDGGVARVSVTSGLYLDTLAGGCVEERFRGLRVSPFAGEPVTIETAFRLR